MRLAPILLLLTLCVAPDRGAAQTAAAPAPGRAGAEPCAGLDGSALNDCLGRELRRQEAELANGNDGDPALREFRAEQDERDRELLARDADEAEALAAAPELAPEPQGGEDFALAPEGSDALPPETGDATTAEEAAAIARDAQWERDRGAALAEEAEDAAAMQGEPPLDDAQYQPQPGDAQYPPQPGDAQYPPQPGDAQYEPRPPEESELEPPPEPDDYFQQ